MTDCPDCRKYQEALAETERRWREEKMKHEAWKKVGEYFGAVAGGGAILSPPRKPIDDRPWYKRLFNGRMR